MILPAGYSDDARTLWDVATALNRAAAAVSPKAAGLPPLLFLTDPERTPQPWETAARLPPGSAVIYRAFGAPDAIEIGRRLRVSTATAGARLLVGLDADLADALEADGLHLPERAMNQAPAVRRLKPDWLITAAWHGDIEPQTNGLDALILSPVFPAGSLGLETGAWRRPFCDEGAGRQTAGLWPGGVGPDNAASLIGSGACGLAGVGAVAAAFAAPSIRT